MNKIKLSMLCICMLFTIVSCFPQTPEQKKQAEEAQKEVDKAQKKLEEMMKNNPQMKKMMEQLKMQDSLNKTERVKKKDVNKRTNNNKKKNTEHLDHYKITPSNAKKFNNWKHGQADIFLVTIAYNSRNNESYKIGTMQPNGSFDISMPESANPDKKIATYFGCTNGFNGTKTNYINPDAMIVRSYIAVKKEGKQIGILYMATSREQIAENTLMDDYYGIPGYTLQWWYANKETSAKANCSKSKVDTAEIHKVFDINFNQGWNLVKTEFTGERVKTHNRAYYKTQKYSVIPALPSNVRWVFN